ncbi:uncharacterized protein LOC134545117 [Bacillus rossius redtenbacheri]|uniref:uncharacterized protein LOC134545117 n=1 Tax=Bacillus rossius redtenbacheri TaxID=93214 RepID=UPI002FDCF4C4
MATLIPEFLLKDELAFECQLRGVPCEDTTAAVFRKRLRTALQSNLTVDCDKLVNLNPNDEFNLCASKILVLQELVSNLDDENFISTLPRVKNRLAHLNRRVQCLLDIHSPKLSEVQIASLETILIEIQKLGDILNKSETEFSLLCDLPPVSSIAQVCDQLGRLALPTSLPQIPDISPVPGPSKQDVEPVCSMTGNLVTLPNLTYVSAKQPASANAHVVFSGVPSTHQATALSNKVSFSNVFGKLTHPLEKMLKDFPATDGLHIPKFLHFLQLIVKLRQSNSLHEAQLLEIIYPFTLGPLAEQTNLAISQNLTFDKYHEDILSFFYSL